MVSKCIAKLIVVSSLFVSLSSMATDVEECLALSIAAERLACYDQAHGFSKADEAVAKGVQQTVILNQPIAAAESTDTTAPKVAETSVGDSAKAEAQRAYDKVIEDAKVMTVKRKSVSQGYEYYLTESGRKFRTMSRKSTSIDVVTKLKIEKGFLGSMFLISDTGKRVKAKEL